MKVPFTLGEVGHFGLAVRNPRKSAKWFERALGLRQQFVFENGVAVGNDYVTIALFKGKPSPETIDHMSFHLPDMATLRKALAHLKKVGAELEDPGDEIGPEAPGSKNMGLWFRDPDGYRWELSVLGGQIARAAQTRSFCTAHSSQPIPPNGNPRSGSRSDAASPLWMTTDRCVAHNEVPALTRH